jgi:hypothetical protein
MLAAPPLVVLPQGPLITHEFNKQNYLKREAYWQSDEQLFNHLRSVFHSVDTNDPSFKINSYALMDLLFERVRFGTNRLPENVEEGKLLLQVLTPVKNPNGFFVLYSEIFFGWVLQRLFDLSNPETDTDKREYLLSLIHFLLSNQLVSENKITNFLLDRTSPETTNPLYLNIEDISIWENRFLVYIRSRDSTHKDSDVVNLPKQYIRNFFIDLPPPSTTKDADQPVYPYEPLDRTASERFFNNEGSNYCCDLINRVSFWFSNDYACNGETALKIFAIASTILTCGLGYLITLTLFAVSDYYRPSPF